MTAAAALPDEREDPLNAVLDMACSGIETALALGLEPQLRARMARLLPVARADSRSESRPARAQGAAAQPRQRDVETELELAALLTIARRIKGYRLAAGEHEAVSRFEKRIAAELDQLRGATNTSPTTSHEASR